MIGRTLWLALLLGAAIGALAGVYLATVNRVEGLVWNGTEANLPLPAWLGVLTVTVLGGAVVGVLRIRHDRDAPTDLHDALAVLDGAVAGETEPKPLPSVVWMLRAVVLGIVSLAAGASLGPEAPLMVLAMSLGQRAARILHTTRGDAAYISSVGALSGLFGGPLGPVVLPVEGHRGPPAHTARLLGAGIVSGVSGLIAMKLVLPGSGPMKYEIPDPDYDSALELVQGLGWGALAAVPATLIGLLLLVATGPARQGMRRLLSNTVVRAAGGGLILGACGLLVPLSLFSGEHEAQQLIDQAADWTIPSLAAVLAIKLVATLACLATGWFGGQIFPSVFLGMTAGLLVVVVAPHAPIAPVVAAGAGAAATALLRRPLAAVLILLLFFPVGSSVAIAVGAGVAMLAVSILGDRAPAAPKVGDSH